MLDVKDVVRRVFVCSNSSPDIYTSQDLYDPVYQELNNGMLMNRFFICSNLFKVHEKYKSDFGNTVIFI